MLTHLLLSLFLSVPVINDNGFVSRPPFCAAVSWPSLPIAVYYNNLTVEEEDILNDGLLFWNSLGMGQIFYKLDPSTMVVPNWGVIEVFGEQENTIHGRASITYIVLGCRINGATMFVQGSPPWDPNLPLWGRTVHLLGDTLGLAHDFTTHSVMDQQACTDTNILSSHTSVTAYDQALILGAVVF